MNGAARKFLTVGFFLTFLSGCDTHRLDESHKQNLSDMQEALKAGASYKAPESTKALVDETLGLLEENPQKIEIDVTEDALRCNLSVNQEEPTNFFSLVAQTYEVGVVMDKEIQDPITLSLSNATIREVMEALRASYKLDFEKTSYGYRVFKQQLETKIFIINYLDVKRKGTSSTTVNPTTMSSSGTTGSTGSTNNYAQGSSGMGRSGSQVTTQMDTQFWENLEETIHLLIDAPTQVSQDSAKTINAAGNSADSKTTTSPSEVAAQKPTASNVPCAIINRNTGIIVIRAYKEQLAKVQEYLYRTQLIVKRQVILETKILDVQLTDQYATGIQWNQLGAKAYLYKSPFTLGASNMSSGGLSLGKLASGMTLGNTAETLGSTVALTMQKGTTFNAVMQLLSQQGKVSVLSSPRISVINNQKAVIKVGDDAFYPTGSNSNVALAASGGSSNVATSSVDLTSFFSGISMDVTPQISDSDEISLHIHPVVSRVSTDIKKFTVNGQQTELPLAKTTVREADTIVNAKSEQVIIIGGLMQNNVELDKYGLPIKDQTGILDTLFGQKGGARVNSELVILLKPIVVKNDTWSNELTKTMNTAFQG